MPLLSHGIVIAIMTAIIAIVLFRIKYMKDKHHRIKVGFFHPYCDTGGGGERVLWTCVEEVLNTWNHIDCIIYTGDETESAKILEKARDRFGIDLTHHLYSRLAQDRYDARIRFVRLTNRWLVEASTYPSFTLIGQSLGSMILTMEALFLFTPHVFFDSTGYSFSYPLAKVLFGCSVGCYVHYPTISTDMLDMVWQRRPSYNNSKQVSSSGLRTYGKYIYYRIFALCYRFCGFFANVILTNSSWTASHIDNLWSCSSCVVFPPCPVSEFKTIPLSLPNELGDREDIIVSVAQFRPEKDHELQLRSFYRFLKLRKNNENEPMLVLIGGCRNDDDKKRVNELKQKTIELGIENNVLFVINASYKELVSYLSRAHVGIHTMWNEHFGIGVVEYMAAGCIALAHNSGGPKMDIIGGQDELLGYLASNEEEYANCLLKLFSKECRNSNDLKQLRREAREKCELFSDECFKIKFSLQFSRLLHAHRFGSA